MSNLNKVMLIGNLTRDPEVRFTPKGTAVGDVGLAVNRRIKDASDNWTDETTFIDVTIWGKQAEFAQTYLTKGASVFVEGRLQLDSWEDKESGQKRSKLKVVAESIQGLGKRDGGQQAATSQRNAMGGRDVPASEARTRSTAARQATPPDDDGEPENLPF